MVVGHIVFFPEFRVHPSKSLCLHPRMRSIKTIGRMMPKLKKQRPPRDDEEPLTALHEGLHREQGATADDVTSMQRLHVAKAQEDGGESDGGQSTLSLTTPVHAKK